MVIICVTCQSAIFVKRFKENRRDHQIPFAKFIPLSLNEEDQTAASANAQAKFVNNQRWNIQICSIFGNFIVVIILLFIMMNSKLIMMNKLLKGSSITTEEKAQISDHLNEITLQIVIPVYMYVRNSKLRQHVKYEICN